MSKWNLTDAIKVCILLEAICPEYGCHVALTGGVLYKIGERKDLDIVLYRIRQSPFIDREGLFARLEKEGFTMTRDAENKWLTYFVLKTQFEGRAVEFLFPEDDGEYISEECDPDDKVKPSDLLDEPIF